jgi:hypothetical protein
MDTRNDRNKTTTTTPTNDQPDAERVVPMESDGIEHQLERIYDESGTYQWVRELVANALEASATHIEFGIEWQAVQSQGVYRRTIADDGHGMDAAALVKFFKTFGGGGKPIGGVHQNFGVGAKTSLLPWNTYGVVVISWVDGQASMIRLRKDPATGQYGLVLVEATNPDTGVESESQVYTPYYDEEHGCDWADAKPDFIDDHGTLIVLLGDTAQDDTVQGSPSRDEAAIKGISKYLNQRYWNLDGVQITVDSLNHEDKAHWPRSRTQTQKTAGTASAEQPTTRRTMLRVVRGAEHFITYPDHETGQRHSSGTVPLSDGTEIDWYLWEGDRPAVHSYAAKNGYVAVLYRNELYNITNHHNTYKNFGVAPSEVRRNLWLIVRPPEFSDETSGIYPRTDRNELLVRSANTAGAPLPVYDWATEFADQMPDQILAAIKKARGTEEGTITDPAWRDRLADRFGARWRINKVRQAPDGDSLTAGDQAGTTPATGNPSTSTNHHTGGGTGGRRGPTNISSRTGTKPGKNITAAGGLPHFLWEDDDEFDAGMLCSWVPNDPIHPEGVVLLNRDHPVFTGQVTLFCGDYGPQHADGVEAVVHQAYGEIAVAKIAHSEYLKSLLPDHVVEDSLRCDEALTMSLLGLIAEEHLISDRLNKQFRRKKAA